MDIIFALMIAALVLYVLMRSFAESGSRPPSRVRFTSALRLPKEALGTFIVCAFSMLGKLAQVDGSVSSEEVERVDQYIRSRLELDHKTRDMALSVFKEAGSSPLEVKDYAERFQKSFPDKVNLATELVTLLLEVGASDGVLGLEEERNIRSAAILMGLSDPGFERLKKEILGDTPIVH